ncbi:MAG: hypothetical protein K5756_04770 [Clostridiales bacterium]|nr:hypothetical protein [Clostridiales bacterium]
MKEYITKTGSGNIAVDDTLLTKGIETTAGSKILSGFVPLFSADAVERAEKAGYTVAGKTNVGEFGLDLVGEFSYYNDGDEILHGAAAELIAKGEIKGALEVDLNGAPRRAAALSGTDFIKPTYGTVSRYGVIPCACSGEQVGAAAADAQETKKLLTAIAGHDGKDGTSLPAESYDYACGKEIAGMKVGVITQLFDTASEETKAVIKNYAEKLKALGIAVEDVSVEEISAAQSAWQILMAAETCNNVSRYDGVKFGYRTPNYKNIDELYIGSRTEGMNLLTKATVLYGSDVLSKGRYFTCYDKALKVRRVVADKFKELFKAYDALLVPACGKTEYKKYDIGKAFETVYEESAYTAVPNLIGIPAMVTGGVQLMADHFGENILFKIAESAEGTDK